MPEVNQTMGIRASTAKGRTKLGSSIQATLLDNSATTEGIRVLLLSIGGERFEVKVRHDASFAHLKQALAATYYDSVHDFCLSVPACETVPDDATLVSALPADYANGTTEKMVTMYVIKVTTLQRHEHQSQEAWCGLVAKLRNHEICDDDVLVHVQGFLDKYPALINLQTDWSHGPAFQSLLGHAIMSVSDMQLRKKCVDELIKRGARVHIRHASGFLIEDAQHSGSAFVDYLKEKIEESTVYDQDSIAAWRDVSSKLCGETTHQVQDEDEMTRIVKEFCTKYPQMVNFQNNHVTDRLDRPQGYFGYAPLMSFAGAQACRSRRGQASDEKNARKGSIEELLRHGARVDTSHGGKTSMKWMVKEGSKLIDWLVAQLQAPMPEQEIFSLQLPSAAAHT